MYPIEYGADPTGENESSDAIMKAIEATFEMDNLGLELLPGIRDLGGVIIDFQGGNYKISNPITFPSSAGNLVVIIFLLFNYFTFPLLLL